MKTKMLILGVVVTAFTFTTVAGDVFLSPRAKDNQTKIVKSSTDTFAATVASTATETQKLMSPRAAGSQLKVASGTVKESNPYLECRNSMTGSPKAVQACSENSAMRACMTVAPLK